MSYFDLSSVNGRLPAECVGQVQQFTGLKDIYGIDIYEGDVLHYAFDGASYPKEAQNLILKCVYDKENGWFSFEGGLDKEEFLWYEIVRHAAVIANTCKTPKQQKIDSIKIS